MASRSLKDLMYDPDGRANLPHRRVISGVEQMKYADGGDVEGHWMQDAHPKKGALHAQLHIPQGQKIPTDRLEEAEHAKSPLLRKRANLAMRYRGL